MKKWIFIIIAVLVIGGGVAGYLYYKSSANKSDAPQSESTQTSSSPQAVGTKTIVAVISDNTLLNTFSAALKTTTLSTTLEGVGPYTVLVPTESAFKQLPTGTLDTLLKLDNIEKLKNILNYHIIAGSLTTSQLTNGQRIKTLNGQELTVEITDGTISFIDAKGGKAAIVKGDIAATNGVVHTIDAVLLPQ